MLSTNAFIRLTGPVMVTRTQVAVGGGASAAGAFALAMVFVAPQRGIANAAAIGLAVAAPVLVAFAAGGVAFTLWQRRTDMRWRLGAAERRLVIGAITGRRPLRERWLAPEALFLARRQLRALCWRAMVMVLLAALAFVLIRTVTAVGTLLSLAAVQLAKRRPAQALIAALEAAGIEPRSPFRQ